jgi:hypothetical protein
MNAETVWARPSTFIIAALIAVILILLFIGRPEKPAPIDPHRTTVTFDDQGRINLLDAEGKPREAVELKEPRDVLGEIFKEGLPPKGMLHGAAALILGFPGSSCNPTIIIGNSCSAPHQSCCY